MAFRVSTALRNFLLEGGCLKKAMSNCLIKVYTGSQPATADTATSGTLLVTYSLGAGTPTREVLSSGTVTLTGGASGSVDTVTVNSIDILGGSVAFVTSLTATAAAVATQINNNPKNWLFNATSSGAVITITARPGLGALPNTWVVSATLTTITASYVNMASGVNAVNGLNWGDSAAGTLTKKASESWQGVAAATGTAGWFRVEASVSDAGTTDSSEAVLRIDGAVATSGAEFNMPGSTTITSGSTQTLSDFSSTLPTA